MHVTFEKFPFHALKSKLFQQSVCLVLKTMSAKGRTCTFVKITVQVFIYLMCDLRFKQENKDLKFECIYLKIWSIQDLGNFKECIHMSFLKVSYY